MLSIQCDSMMDLKHTRMKCKKNVVLFWCCIKRQISTNDKRIDSSNQATNMPLMNKSLKDEEEEEKEDSLLPVEKVKRKRRKKRGEEKETE